MSTAGLEQLRTAGLRIGGEDRPASDGATYPVANPAAGAVVAQAAGAGREDVARSVAAARAAFTTGTWQRRPAPQRGEVLAAAAQRIEDRADELALLSINSDSSSYIQAPFGGYGQSGLGKGQGIEGLYDFTEVKNIYLRRPTLLSTIQLADTQPFVSREKNLAVAHNGLFKERDAVRPDYAGRLKGGADSEIGFCMLQDFIDDGVSASGALAMVAGKLGGNANLATLDGTGAITLYSRHETNRFWRFTDGDAQIAATELHSPDDSLFRLIFPAASGRSVVHESVRL